jgi:hypothetical protein
MKSYSVAASEGRLQFEVLLLQHKRHMLGVGFGD